MSDNTTLACRCIKCGVNVSVCFLEVYYPVKKSIKTYLMCADCQSKVAKAIEDEIAKH